MSAEKVKQGQEDYDLRIKNQMGKMIDSYDNYMKRVTFGRENKLRELTVGTAQVKNGDAVLEIGCATGSLTLAIKRKAGATGKVFGIDIIPGMIERSKQKAAEQGVDAGFQEGSIDNIPFPDSQFDVVICSFMIFHMSEGVRQKGIKEIYRVLRPGGRLFVLDLTLPQGGFSRSIMKVFLGFMFKHDLKELFPLMESAGFSGLNLSRFPFRLIGLSLLSFVTGNK